MVCNKIYFLLFLFFSGEFNFSSIELSGDQNTTYYFFVSSQAIKTENFGDSRFGMNLNLTANEIVVNGTYYFVIPIELRQCLFGEIFISKGNKFNFFKKIYP